LAAADYRINVLEATEIASYLEPLAEILKACVHDGANVSFVLPFGDFEAQAFWREKVAPSVADGKRRLLVAEVDGVMAGTVQLNLEMTPNQAHRGEVSKLLVHPRFRRRGIGQALMREVERQAIGAERWLLTLDTADATAERIYRALGFTVAGSIPAFARHPMEDRWEATTYMYKILEDIRPSN
jgi:ribosomal protein S18 acetylase RimI-like enzyme